MIKEDKLLKLLKQAAEIRKNTLEDYGMIDYNYERFEKLSNYIIKGLRSPIGKKQSEKVVAKHFDDILPFIVKSNTTIILFYGKSFLTDPDIKDKITAGLKNYPYPKEIDYLFRLFMSAFNADYEKLNSVLSDEIIDYLATITEQFDYSAISRFLDEDHQKRFLNKIAENKVKFEYVSFDYKGNNRNIIYDNIESFTKNSVKLYSLRDFVHDNPIKEEYVKHYMDAHEDQTLDSIFYDTERFAKITDQTLKDVIKLIVKDIAKNENCKLSDIKYNEGGLSRVLIIGDKVLKIGERATVKFPNNPYIITPLLRRDLDYNGEKCFIEVTEKVDTKARVTEEELYQLYKNLRDLGLIWTDIKAENVGRLTKENIIHWNKQLSPSNEILNFDGSRGNGTLKEGDLVVLDADLIFNEDDPNIIYTDQKHVSKEFAKRYEEEKNNDIINTVKK